MQEDGLLLCIDNIVHTEPQLEGVGIHRALLSHHGPCWGRGDCPLGWSGTRRLFSQAMLGTYLKVASLKSCAGTHLSTWSLEP